MRRLLCRDYSSGKNQGVGKELFIREIRERTATMGNDYFSVLGGSWRGNVVTGALKITEFLGGTAGWRQTSL